MILVAPVQYVREAHNSEFRQQQWTYLKLGYKIKTILPILYFHNVHFQGYRTCGTLSSPILSLPRIIFSLVLSRQKYHILTFRYKKWHILTFYVLSLSLSLSLWNTWHEVGKDQWPLKSSTQQLAPREASHLQNGWIFNPKIYIADFCHYRHYRLRSWISEKKCNMIFQKWRGGESKAVWNFSKNSSVLEVRGFPYG